MKIKKSFSIFFLAFMMLFPTSVLAISYEYDGGKHFNSYMQTSAVVNDVSSSNNLNIVIVGMVIIIIILVGAAIFAKK